MKPRVINGVNNNFINHQVCQGSESITIMAIITRSIFAGLALSLNLAPPSIFFSLFDNWQLFTAESSASSWKFYQLVDVKTCFISSLTWWDYTDCTYNVFITHHITQPLSRPLIIHGPRWWPTHQGKRMTQLPIYLLLIATTSLLIACKRVSTFDFEQNHGAVFCNSLCWLCADADEVSGWVDIIIYIF